MTGGRTILGGGESAILIATVVVIALCPLVLVFPGVLGLALAQEEWRGLVYLGWFRGVGLY